MVSGLHGQDYTAGIRELGLDTLEERRHQADMCIVPKLLQGEADLSHKLWFELAGAGGCATMCYR